MDGVDLRLGDWREVLADVRMVDAVITDAPFSQTTHEGALSRSGDEIVEGVTQYAHWPEDDAIDFCRRWCERCCGWVVIHNDDILGPLLRAGMAATGRYAFPLLPVLQHQPRVTGDGPAQHGHYLAVSRPREQRFLSWGSLPGWYEAPREKGAIRGAKPLGLMRAIVRDYTRPGDLVCDPFTGSGTTALACMIEGRRFVGAELNPEHYEIAMRRIRQGVTRDMFSGAT